jgi:cell division protein ZapA (FtsZ GTPase activity inhibitor)
MAYIVKIWHHLHMAQAAEHLEKSAEVSKSDLYWSRGALKNTEISVGGVKVKVRTDATPNHLKLVRELVESRFESFSDRLTKGYSTEQLTVLVAFNLAVELLKERSKTKFLKKSVVECTERLLNRVESFLGRRSPSLARDVNKTR